MAACSSGISSPQVGMMADDQAPSGTRGARGNNDPRARPHLVGVGLLNRLGMLLVELDEISDTGDARGAPPQLRYLELRIWVPLLAGGLLWGGHGWKYRAWAPDGT